MPSKTQLKFNLKPLKEIEFKLQQKYFVKLGILGSSAVRDGEVSNAEIGAFHEFGSISQGTPRRSFLFDTIIEKQEDLNKVFGKGLAKALSGDGNIKNAFELLGAQGEANVFDAFETSGFGKWEALSESTKEYKAEKNLSPNILQASLQLKGAITSRVEKDK